MPKLRDAAPQFSGDVTEGLAERPEVRPLSSAQRDARRRQRAAHREARRTGSGAKED